MKSIVEALQSMIAGLSRAILPGKRSGMDYFTTWAIRRLHKIGLLESTEVQLVDEGSPNMLAKLLEEHGRMLILDKRDYAEPEAPDHYRPLFERLKGINEDVDFELVGLELQEKEMPWGPGEAILATIRRAGQTYRSGLPYSKHFRVAGDYFQVINQTLADSDSRYRLFGVTIFCEGEDCESNIFYDGMPVNLDRFGIISLTHEQAELIERSRLLPISGDGFKVLKTGEITRVLDEYRAAGLLHGLSEAEIERASADILLEQHYDRQSLIHHFGPLICSFDIETANFENPYEEITLELAGISRGRFQPKSIVDRYQPGRPSEFSFELNGRTYETTPQNNGDWLDPAFIVLINRALAEQGIDGHFYTLYDDSQVATMLFLSRQQHDEAVRRQLVTFAHIGD